MNILIDFTQIPLKKTGAGVYGLNLVSQIALIDTANTYFVLTQDDEHALDSFVSKHFRIVKIYSRLFRIKIFRVFFEQFFIPCFILKYHIDIVHSLHYSFPLIAFGAKRVVTVMDMSFIKYPQYHEFFKKYYFKMFIKLAGIMADKVISVSASTLRDFISLTGTPRGKMSLIHLGINRWPASLLTPKAIEQAKIKYGIRGNYLLFLGTIEPRKNIVRLIKAYHNVLKKNKDFKLVIVGMKGWGYRDVFKTVDSLGLRNKIVFTGFIDEEDKLYIIKGAFVFIYPSLFEGFGLPVLEALSLGVPTITSNVASLPEIAGTAAILIDPSSVDSIFNAIIKLINNETICDKLKSLSVIQAEKFNWKTTAQKTILLYKQTL